ncbi:hypothetical protein Tco_0406777, partial [Tanacetum coccineum]
LLGDQKIVGTKLSEKAFKEAALEVFQNRADSPKWRHHFGITALMISEVARFVPFKDALAENFANGTEMLPCGWSFVVSSNQGSKKRRHSTRRRL